MSYKKANDILPRSLLSEIQKYIDGEYIYIPRKENTRAPWGATTGIKQTLQARNREILARRRAGCSAAQLAEHYFLSEKAIYKILKAAQNG